MHMRYTLHIVRYAQCTVQIASTFMQGCTMAEVGKPPARESRQSTWVQTERAAHEAWSRLIAKAPMAARLAHVLVAHMSPANNAVVASQTTLGELMASHGERPVHRNSVRNAINILVSERWIEVVQIGGKGGALAYVVNARIAWSRSRNEIRYSTFSAQVIASETEQSESIDDRPALRQVPVLLRGEQQLPAGPGEPPPAQTILDGMEPDLPFIQAKTQDESTDHNNKDDQLRLID